MVWISHSLALAILGYLTFEDVKKQKVPLFMLLAFLLTGAALKAVMDPRGLPLSLLLAFWLLLGCLVARKLSQGGLGQGDVWILFSLPFWKEGSSLFAVIAAAFISAALYGTVRYGW